MTDNSLNKKNQELTEFCTNKASLLLIPSLHSELPRTFPSQGCPTCVRSGHSTLIKGDAFANIVECFQGNHIMRAWI